ncbi:MAG: hypothetical protein FWF44_05350 [Defluviitaleaceae bacterium]|nr:hypothetical protein [Defluviitaleaceae bacterium]
MADNFTSLLYSGEPEYTLYSRDPLFADLHIDQILAPVTEGLEDFRLAELYLQRPASRKDAEFRAAVSRDLWDDDFRGEIEAFLIRMNKTRRFLGIADTIHETPVREKWTFDGALEYAEAVTALCARDGKAPESEGLGRFLAWLQGYAGSEAFAAFRGAALSLKAKFDGAAYSLRLDLNGNTVYFGPDAGSDDFCAGLLAAFDRYDLRNAKREIAAFGDVNINILERRILAVIQNKRPDLSAELCDFCARFGEFINEKVLAFEREAQYYVSYIQFAKRLEGKGFPFSLPRFCGACLRISGGYDMSLALVKGDAALVVENGFEIRENERSFLLTGPNQGGKTTFSRMFGQIMFFSSLGLPMPCREAEILCTGGLETHFNAEENPAADSGRLREELVRLRKILRDAPAKSVVILNELFSSTTTFDALEMGARVLRRFEEKGCVCLYVTHLFELAQSGGAVSLAAETDGGDPPAATFRISRNLPGGNAFAERLLAKRGLRREEIKERVANAAVASVR